MKEKKKKYKIKTKILRLPSWETRQCKTKVSKKKVMISENIAMELKNTKRELIEQGQNINQINKLLVRLTKNKR